MEQEHNLEPLMTRLQVAKYLQVSLRTVITYEQKGWLIPYKIGGSAAKTGAKRYKVSDVRDFVHGTQHD